MRALSLLLIRLLYEYIYQYPTASNINIFWNFGILSGFCLVIQIVTGLFMSMYYTATTADAMSSIEHMMRDINYGWLVRFAHSNGASAFFVAVYIHMFRSFYYGTYSYPNDYVWYVGAVIYFCLMGTAFLGYVLPWGQMSYWGATVITNLVTILPVIGKDLLLVIWGGDTLCDSTLQRFYSFHFLLPFLILGLAMLHIYLLHKAGSRHPIGYDNRSSNKIAFFPYFVAKDSMIIILFFMGYVYLVLLEPDMLGHPDNYIDANPCVTPSHIVPEWYFLPMYAILRCIPSKVGGAVAMFIFILLMFFIPLLSQHVVGSYRFSANRSIYWLGVAQVLCLTYLGAQLPVDPFDWLSQLCLFITIFILINWDIAMIRALKLRNFVWWKRAGTSQGMSSPQVRSIQKRFFSMASSRVSPSSSRIYQIVIFCLVLIICALLFFMYSVTLVEDAQLFLKPPVNLPMEFSLKSWSDSGYCENIQTWQPIDIQEVNKSNMIRFSPFGCEGSFHYLTPNPKESAYYAKGSSPLYSAYFKHTSALMSIEDKFGLVTWHGCPLYVESGDMENVYVKLNLEEACRIDINDSKKVLGSETSPHPDDRETGNDEHYEFIGILGLCFILVLCHLR